MSFTSRRSVGNESAAATSYRPRPKPLSLQDALSLETDYIKRKLHQTSSSPSRISSTAPPRSGAGRVLRILLGTAGRTPLANPAELLAICLSFGVGINAIRSTPFFIYRNGGVAALIPLFVAMVLFALPLMHLELAVGYLSRRGPMGAFSGMAPAFRGMGWALIWMCLLVAYSASFQAPRFLLYFWTSVTSDLSWTSCGHFWNSQNCTSLLDQRNCYRSESSTPCLSPAHPVSASFEFLLNYVHNQREGSGWLSVFPVLSPLTASAAVVWSLVLVVLLRGPRTLGKMAYVCASVPWLVLIALLASLIASPDLDFPHGISTFLRPDWHKLLLIKTWSGAWTTAWEGVSAGLGVYVTAGSFYEHMPQRSPVVAALTPLLVSLGHLLFSVLSGVIIFGVLGGDVPSLSVEALLVEFPEKSSLFAMGTPWSCLLFFLCFALSFSYLVPIIWSVIVSLLDGIPALFRYQTLVTMMSCFIFFLLAIPMRSESGLTLARLLSTPVSASFMLSSLLFVLVVAYAYGWYNVQRDLILVLDLSESSSVFRRFFGPSSSFYSIAWLGLVPIAMTFLACEQFLSVWSSWGLAPFHWSECLFCALLIPMPLLLVVGFLFGEIIRAKFVNDEPIGRLLSPKATLPPKLVAKVLSINPQLASPSKLLLTNQYTSPGGNDNACWCCCGYRVASICVTVVEIILVSLGGARVLWHLSSVSLAPWLFVPLSLAHVLILLLHILSLVSLIVGVVRHSTGLLVPYLVWQSAALGFYVGILTWPSAPVVPSAGVWFLVLCLCVVKAWTMTVVAGTHWEFREDHRCSRLQQSISTPSATLFQEDSSGSSEVYQLRQWIHSFEKEGLV